MASVTNPDKQLVRDHLQKRWADHTPPPSLEEQRRQLGWFLVPTNKAAAK